MNVRLKIGIIGVAVIVLSLALAGRVGRTRPPVKTFRAERTSR